MEAEIILGNSSDDKSLNSIPNASSTYNLTLITHIL
jgi:hypothetical protein